jgi:hypothetical protein
VKNTALTALTAPSPLPKELKWFRSIETIQLYTKMLQETDIERQKRVEKFNQMYMDAIDDGAILDDGSNLLPCSCGNLCDGSAEYWNMYEDEDGDTICDKCLKSAENVKQ